MLDSDCEHLEDTSPCSIVYRDDIVDRVIERDIEQHMLSQASATTSPPYAASAAAVPNAANAALKPSKYGCCLVCQDIPLFSFFLIGFRVNIGYICLS